MDFAIKGQILKTNASEGKGHKPFTFVCTMKKVKIPSFAWKAKDGKESLQTFLNQIEKLAAEIKQHIQK